MSRQGILQDLTELLELETPLAGTEMLTEIETWDSMAVIGFISMADDRYKVNIPASRIRACQTVDDLVDLLQPVAV